MGIISTVLTRYKADTKDQERALKKLRGEEKKRAKQTLDSMKKENERIDGQIEKWGKLAIGIGGVVVAAKGAAVAFKAFQEDTRLRSAAAGADISALTDATRGLIDEQKLLQLAAAGMNTEFQLSQHQLQQVGQFMLTLRAKGHDLETSFEEVKTAIQETNVEGLHKFGIHVDAASETLEGFEGIMSAIEKENHKFAGSLDLAGDSAQRMAVRVQNAWQDIKVKAGETTNEILQFIDEIEKKRKNNPAASRIFFGNFFGNLGEVAGGRDHLGIGPQVQGNLIRAAERKRRAEAARHQKMMQESFGLLHGLGEGDSDKKKPSGSRGPGSSGQIGALLQSAASLISQAGSLAGGGTEALGGSILGQARSAIANTNIGLADESLTGRAARGFRSAFGSLAMSDEEIKKFEAQQQILREQALKTQATFQLFEQTAMGVSKAFGTAFADILTGQKGLTDALGDAFKALIKQFVGEFTMRAAMETGKGIAALAVGSPTAGAHFKAAGVFAAGAAGAALLGHATGSFDSPSAGGAAGGSRSIPSGARVGGPANGNGPAAPNVIIWRDVDGDPRKEAQRVRRLLRASEQYTGGRTVRLGA